jgi:hypothetical protein
MVKGVAEGETARPLRRLSEGVAAVLVQAIPPALMAALYPPALLVIAYLLAGPRPVRSSLAFLAGAAAITVAVGVALVLFLHGTGIDDSSKHRSVPPAIDVILGAALLVLAAVMARRPRRPEQADPKQRKQRSMWGLVAFGAALYVPSVFYLTALHEISQSDTGGLAVALSLLLIAVIVLLFVEVPIILYLRAPDRTGRLLDRWNDWLSRNVRSIIVVAAAVIGIYLLASGIAKLIG